MIKLTAREYTSTPMEQPMPVIGLKISNMVKELRHGLTVPATTEATKMVKKMVMAL